MDAQTINQLKELKSLVEQGILTQEEFETEKDKLLNQHEEIAFVEPDDVQVVKSSPVTKPQVNSSYQTIRPGYVRNVPPIGRYDVMNATTPEEAHKKFQWRYNAGVLYTIIAGVFSLAFIYQCHTSGFWGIFFACFWALFPALVFGIPGIMAIFQYKDLKDMFQNVSQDEFVAMQNDIQQKRDGYKNAAGEFISNAQNAYSETTGGRNIWFDLGSYIGSKL